MPNRQKASHQWQRRSTSTPRKSSPCSSCCAIRPRPHGRQVRLRRRAVAAPAPCSWMVSQSAPASRRSQRGRQRDHHHRGPGERRQAAPASAGFPGAGAMQCGYCTCGMIMSGVGLLRKNPDPTPRRDHRVHEWQYLPLWNLSANHRRPLECRQSHEGGPAMNASSNIATELETRARALRAARGARRTGSTWIAAAS